MTRANPIRPDGARRGQVAAFEVVCFAVLVVGLTCACSVLMAWAVLGW